MSALETRRPLPHEPAPGRFRFELEAEPVRVDLMGQASVTLRSIGDGRLVSLDASECEGWVVTQIVIDEKPQLSEPVALSMLGEGTALRFDAVDVDSRLWLDLKNDCHEARTIAIRARFEDRFMVLRGHSLMLGPDEISMFFFKLGAKGRPFRLWSSETEELRLLTLSVHGEAHRIEQPLEAFCRESLEHLGELGRGSALGFLLKNIGKATKAVELRLVYEV